MSGQNTPPAHQAPPLAEVWVLIEESRNNSCEGEAISLFSSEAEADRERLLRIHQRWSELPLFEDDAPETPPADAEEAIEIYNEAREGERINNPWQAEIAPVPGYRARVLWPDAETGGDPALEIGGIVIGVREEREPHGLVVWIGADTADQSWSRDTTGKVPVEVVLNDEVIRGPVVEGTAPQDIAVPRRVAEKYCEAMGDATIENPVAEHTTCPEYTATRSVLEEFERAGVPGAAKALDFQAQGHAKSYVCVGDHEPVTPA